MVQGVDGLTLPAVETIARTGPGRIGTVVLVATHVDRRQTHIGIHPRGTLPDAVGAGLYRQRTADLPAHPAPCADVGTRQRGVATDIEFGTTGGLEQRILVGQVVLVAQINVGLHTKTE